MIEKKTQITEAEEIKKLLKTESLNKAEPIVISYEDLTKDFTELSRQQIVDTIFNGYESHAETFFELIEDRQDIKIYSSSKDKMFRMEVPSWNGVDDYSMIMEYSYSAIKSQFSGEAKNIWIVNKDSNHAFSIKSLLPPQKNDETNPISLVFNRAYESTKDNIHSFGAGVVLGIGDSISVGEVHDQDTLSSVLHELGHVWSKYLGIDIEKRTKNNLKEMAWNDQNDDVLRIVQEIGFGERMANIIGRLIGYKFNKTNFLPEDNKFQYQETLQDYSGYDAVHAQHHLPLYDQIKNSFVARTNRTKEGKKEMDSVNKWINEELSRVVNIIKTIADNKFEIDTKGKVSELFYEDNVEGLKRSFKLVKDENGKIMEVSGLLNPSDSIQNVTFNISLFSGVSFSDYAFNQVSTSHITVGQLWKSADRKKTKMIEFEHFIKRNLKL
jgi:hypothetical protein